MTFTDKLIQYYYWFKYGYAEAMTPVAIINITAVIITLITVKGIDVPTWVIIIVPILGTIGCVSVGWFMQKYNINGRMRSVDNLKNNPEIKKIYEDVDYALSARKPLSLGRG